MRTLRAIYHIPIRAASPEGTLSAVGERLSDVSCFDFDAVLLSSFDSRAGSMRELVSLCARLRALGLSVLLDIASLYSGVGTPAPVIDAVVRQGVADGLVLTHREWQLPDVRETVRLCCKENADLLFFVSDTYAMEGERPDAAARRGFTPTALLSAEDADTAWAAELAAVGRTRHRLLTPLISPREAMPDAGGDLALLLAWLLPGMPAVGAAMLHPLLGESTPTDAGRHAERRRTQLLLRLGALRRTYPSLALTQGALHSRCEGGVLTFARRVSDGVLTVCACLTPAEGEITDRTVLTTPPLLSTGLYRREGRTYLSGYGFAVCFTKKTVRPPAETNSEAATETPEPTEENAENANEYIQNEPITGE